MKTKKLATCVFCGILLLAACKTNKSDTPATADNSQTSATDSSQNPNSASSSQPAAKQEAPAPVAVAPPPPPPPPPKPVVIPSGTVLTVRLAQAVGSKASQTGERFQASLAEPVAVNGKTVIPAGASAAGSVTEAHAAGRFKGGATLNIVLDSVTIKGTPYHIQTMAMSQTSKGKGKRTAGMIGGGAGAGALIGGLAGGGKGAAIGAAVGAGAGTAGAAFTGNRDITLPAESAVSFQMTSSLTLKPVVTTESADAAPPQ
jgi:hypothetical protein